MAHVFCCTYNTCKGIEFETAKHNKLSMLIISNKPITKQKERKGKIKSKVKKKKKTQTK